jgi:hypothetical protein
MFYLVSYKFLSVSLQWNTIPKKLTLNQTGSFWSSRWTNSRTYVMSLWKWDYGYVHFFIYVLLKSNRTGRYHWSYIYFIRYQTWLKCTFIFIYKCLNWLFVNIFDQWVKINVFSLLFTSQKSQFSWCKRSIT